jgi:hypothetical protein
MTCRRLCQRYWRHAKKIDKYLEDYKPLISSDEDRQLLQNDYQALAEYDDIRGQALALLQGNKSDQAYRLLMVNQHVLIKIEDVFQDHRNFNYNPGKKSTEEGISIKNTAALLSLLVAAVVLTIPVFVIVLTFP